MPDSSAARIPPGVKGVNAVQEEGPVGGVPEPGGLPAASSAAQPLDDEGITPIETSPLLGSDDLADKFLFWLGVAVGLLAGVFVGIALCLGGVL